MTNSNESKKITAKFSGGCTGCGGIVPSGTQCYWVKGVGVRHIVCPEATLDDAIRITQEAARKADEKQVTVTMGVFKKDNRIYVVKPNKEKTRVYAKEIVESPERMTENGIVVDFTTVYRPGVIFSLTEADRWDLADAKDFLTKFSRCIVCGRHLKAAKSVASSIGPICAKYFGSRDCSHSAPKSQPVLDTEDTLKARKIAAQIASDDAAADAEFACGLMTQQEERAIELRNDERSARDFAEFYG